MRLICLIGNDGAGKTTQIKLLRERLVKKNVSSSFVHFDHFFLRVPFFLQGKGLFDNRAQKNQSIKLFKQLKKSRLVGLIFPLIVYFDFLLFFLYLQIRYRQGLVFLDRYFYDAVIKFVDLGVFQKNLAFLLLKITPRPTKTFLLDLPSQLAYQRKKDLTPTILERRRKAYLEFLKFPFVILIKADRDKKKVNNDLWEQMIKFKNIVIAHHVATPFCLIEEELKKFLLPLTDKLIYISHPFKNAREGVALNSRVEYYENSILKKSQFLPLIKGPEVLFFGKDFLFNLYLILKERGKIDLFFGVDNLNALAGIVFKKIGKVKKTIYYVIDYVPLRFENRILNKIYHWCDLLAVKMSDETWNLTSAMAQARIKDGLAKQYLAKQKTVPVGCHPLKRLPRKKKIEKSQKRLVFLGHLGKEQGVDILIKALPKIKKALDKVELHLIGSGEEQAKLKALTARLELKKAVKFYGYIKEKEKVDQILAGCHLGLCPYRLTKRSYKNFADPSKTKTYLGLGLPVVMTKITYFAPIILKKKAGLVVNDRPGEISQAVIKILKNNQIYQQYRHNAFKLAQKYDWNNIFQQAMLK